MGARPVLREWALAASPPLAGRPIMITLMRRGDRFGVCRGSILALAVAVLLGVQPVATAQSPRSWAGSEVIRAPLRVAAVPDAFHSSDTSAAVALPQRDGAGALDGGDRTETLIPTGNLLAVLRDGGLLMVPLIGCSFALVVFGLERLVNLRTGRVVPKPFVDRFVAQIEAGELDREEALRVCATSDSPAAAVFAAAIRRWGRPVVEIEQAAIDACEREINRLRRYRRVFSGIATIGPLLGLLGTVFGLIRSFNDVATAGAMGRPDLLAKGFGEALITTAAGLLVAIPAMTLHWLFISRVDRLAMRLDEVGQRVIDSISLESVASRSPPRRPANGG